MRTFFRVLALALCVAMLFTTAFAAEVSFVKFETANGKVTARVNVRNYGSDAAVDGKIIVGAYDANGNLISGKMSDKYSVAKNSEQVLSASVDAVDGATYKAFVWNDAFSTGAPIHAVKGALTAMDFVADTGCSNGKQSSTAVATYYNTAVTNGILYSALRGRTSSEASLETGARLTSNSNLPANGVQYHEICKVDPSLEGYDYFAFGAGNVNYSTHEKLLEFDVVADCEVIILASNANLEFEGYEPEVAEDCYVDARYIAAPFANSLRTIGVTPTYALAAKCPKAKTDEFFETYLKSAYEAATDEKKASFDSTWTSYVNSKVDALAYPGKYIAKYTQSFTATPEAPAKVVVPGSSVSGSSRNLIVVIKANQPDDIGNAFTPLTTAANLDAAPALTGVSVNGDVVDIADFVNNEYSYVMDASVTNVLPVVKGVAADTSLYTTTDYAISDDKTTATATVTVKNLYTSAVPVTYTVNLSLEVPQQENEGFIKMGSATWVNDTGVVTDGSYTPATGAVTANPLGDTLTCFVAGKTYPQYVDYVNEVTGGNYVATGDTGTKTISGTYIGIAPEPFAVGAVLGKESGRRKVMSVADEFSFLIGCERTYGTTELGYDTSASHGFISNIYYGLDRTITEAEPDITVNAKTDNLPMVPWYSIDINEDCRVYVAAYKALPELLTKGYTLVSSGKEIYHGLDTKNTETTSDDGEVNGPTYLYMKEYKVNGAPVAVEIYNENTHGTTTHPSSYFFKFGKDESLEYTYGKKSSAAVASAFNSTVTNGVLYKDMFASDSAYDAFCTGGRWVTDMEPANASNIPYHRIVAVNDPTLEGAEYFAFKNGSRNYASLTSNLLEFDVAKDCEVLILTTTQDSTAVFEGFTKVSGDYLNTVYPNNATAAGIQKTGYPAYMISIGMVEDFYKTSKLTWAQLYDKYYKDVITDKTSEELRELFNLGYDGATSANLPNCFATADSIAVEGQTSKYYYTYAHVKEFKANDKVVIPVPTGKTGNYNRSIIVAVRPKVYETTFVDHVTDFTNLKKIGTMNLGTTAISNSGNPNDFRLTPYTVTGSYSTAPAGSSFFDSFAQRVYTGTDEIIGIENTIYLRGDNSVLGKNAEWNGTDAYAGQPDVKWMTFRVNQDAEIILVPKVNCDPKFVKDAANGWTKVVLDRAAFTMTRYGTSTTTIPKVMYVKSVKAGSVVDLYNSNLGTLVGDGDNIPYHVFVRVK